MGPRLRAAVLIAAVLAAALGLAYSNSLTGAFVLDDSGSITDNPSIRSLGTALFPPSGGLTVTGRPILNLSLALDYAVWGTDPRGYHFTNLLIHFLAALVLFGLVRRSVSFSNVSPNAFAFSAVILWALHPLQTESVTYTIQRAESLSALFYLLTLYGTARASDNEGRAVALWSWAAVIACALGMGTKEITVSAPVVTLLYDVTFISGSLRDTWHKRKALYLGLAATWIPLILLVLSTHGRGGTSGFGVALSPSAYWMTQPRAIVHYVRLALWPRPLVFDYGLMPGWIRDPASAIPALILLLGLFLASVYGLRRRSIVAFLGFTFFALLAPTSLIPGARQTLAEHRMYLALAPVIFLGLGALVKGVESFRLGGRTSSLIIIVFALSAGTVLGCATWERNATYQTARSLWSDTAAHAPDNPFAHTALGSALLDSGRAADAEGQFKEAIRLYPDYAPAHDNLGALYLGMGRSREALAELKEATRIDPSNPQAHHNLGSLFAQEGQSEAAIAEFKEAVRLDPGLAEAHNSLGILLDQGDQLPEALTEFIRVVSLEPRSAQAHNNLANVLRQLGRTPEAKREYETALRLDPSNEDARANLASLAP